MLYKCCLLFLPCCLHLASFTHFCYLSGFRSIWICLHQLSDWALGLWRLKELVIILALIYSLIKIQITWLITYITGYSRASSSRIHFSLGRLIMRDALFALDLAFRPQTCSPLLCKKWELGELQGIVEYLKCCW